MVPLFTVYSDTKPAASEDPLVFLESVTSSRYHSTESLDDKNDSSISDLRKTDSSSSRGEIFDEVDDFDGFVSIKLKSIGGGGESEDSLHAARASTEPSYRSKESGSTLFDIPTSVSDSHFFANGSNFSDTSSEFVETNANVGVPSSSNGTIENLEGIWLDVNEVPLFTQLTCSPPPARTPPKPPLSNIAMTGEKDSIYSDKNPPNSAIDDLEGFAFRSYPRSPGDGWSKMPTSKEDFEENYTTAAYAAAVNDDIFKMEKKSKHANEQMESEKDSKADKSRKSTPIREDGKNNYDKYERDNRHRRMQLDRDQREKEVKTKARMKFERDREEREKERRAVEIVTREARERAATDARLRAERAAGQKASAEAPKRAEVEARDKALAEARERAVAREKVLAEARERTETREKASAVAREMAAVKGRGRVEKTAAEAKERADRERRARERAAFERAATEARIRAQAEARDKAAAAAVTAAAKERHQKNESFFGMNARPNSAPKQRTTCESIKKPDIV